MAKLSNQKHLLNTIKSVLPLGLIFISFWQRSVLLRQIALYAPEYPSRPVGVDGYPFYVRFLLLQEGNIPPDPDGNFPLFIYFLNTLKAVYNYPVEQVFVPYLVQNLLVLVAAAFTYKIGSWLFSRNVGLLSIFAVLFYGRILNYSLAYANAIPILFFFTGAIFFVLAYQRTSRLRYLWLGSLFLGLSALGRGTTLTQIAVFALWFTLLKVSLKKIALNCLILCGTVAVVLAGPMLHNYKTYHQFVFINTNGAMNLFIGNNPDAHGQFYVPLDIVSVVRAGDSSYQAEILTYITQQPVDWLMLMLKKFATIFIFPWWRVGYLAQPSVLWLGFTLVVASVCVFYSIKVFTRYRSILYLTIIGYAVPIAIFFVEERFRIPMLPVLFIGLSAVLVQISQDIAQRFQLSYFVRWALLFGSVVTGVVIYTIYPQQKIGQAIGEINAPAISGGLTIGQSFVSPCDNLSQIDVKIRTNNPKISQQTAFHLKEGGMDGPEIYSQVLDTQNVRRADYTRFTFPAIPDSAGKSYTFFFDTSAMQAQDNGLIVIIEPDIPVDTVESGAALFNGQLMPADLTFFARCRSIFDW